MGQSLKRCAVITGNLGGFDPLNEWVEQVPPAGWELTRYVFTDANFPPRHKAMTSRLQPGILKMLGWQIITNYDAYIWVDASRTVIDPNYCAWMLQCLGDADFALYRHPLRKTIKQEAQYILDKMRAGSQYLISRYDGEWIEEQVEAIMAEPGYNDHVLYASTALAYRPTGYTKRAMIEWWYHKTRYFLHDQLALPVVVWKHLCTVSTIEESVYSKTRWLYTRPKNK